MIRAESIGNYRPQFDPCGRGVLCTGRPGCVGCCVEAWSRGVPNRNTRPTFRAWTTFPPRQANRYYPRLERARIEARRYFGVQS